jgi:hypothetical protein
MNMKGIAYIVFGVGAFLFAFYGNAVCCVCDLPLRGSLKKQVTTARAESQAVFSGTVLEIVHVPGNHYVTVKFNVDMSWKGPGAEEINIVTGSGGGDCGYHFDIGTTYLVYATGSRSGTLSTNICQRTHVLSNAENEVQILGKGSVPLKRES